MMYPHGQERRRVEAVRIFFEKAEEVNFCDFVRTSFMDGLLISMPSRISSNY